MKFSSGGKTKFMREGGGGGPRPFQGLYTTRHTFAQNPVVQMATKQGFSSEEEQMKKQVPKGYQRTKK